MRWLGDKVLNVLDESCESEEMGELIDIDDWNAESGGITDVTTGCRSWINRYLVINYGKSDKVIDMYSSTIDKYFHWQLDI